MRKRQKQPFLKYIPGGFIVGVPARDLTFEEASKFDIDALLRSGRYMKIAPVIEEREDKALPGPSEDKAL